MTVTPTDQARPGQSPAPSMRFPDYLKYGLGMVGNQIMRDVPSTLLLFYMTNTLLISPAIAGFAILVPKLWVIIADPMVGVLSDKAKGRWGPRKPFLLAGSIVSTIMFVLMFSLPTPESPFIATAVIGGCYLLLSTGYSLYSVPYLALAADLGRSQRERTLAMAYKHFFCLAGVVVAAGIAPWMIEALGQDRFAYRMTSLVLGAILFATTMFTALAVPVRQVGEAGERPAGNLFDQLAGAFSHRPYRIVFFAATLQLFGFGVSAAMGLYFIIYVLDFTLATIGGTAMIAVAAAVASQPLWVWLAKRLGTIATYQIASASAGASTFLLMLIPPGELVPYMMLSIVTGGTTCGFTMMSFAALVEAIAEDGEDSNRKALFAAIYTAMEKAMLAIGGFVTAMILSGTGFVQGASAEAQPESVLTAMLLATVYLSAGLQFASVIVLMFYHRTPAGQVPETYLQEV